MGIKFPSRKELDKLLGHYILKKDEIDLFRKQVVGFFEVLSQPNSNNLPLVHSVKSRLKDASHLEEKIRRKWPDGVITVDSLLKDINDLAGVRILHLHTAQFSEIHAAILDHIEQGYWVLGERPVAYSWDPETTTYFRNLGLKAVQRETYYTSVHYIVKPHKKTDLTCEIQVRTLFEEVWGEIDHALNYPEPTKVMGCKEQLRVLAKLASTGTRLADSIFKIAPGKAKLRR